MHLLTVYSNLCHALHQDNVRGCLIFKLQDIAADRSSTACDRSVYSLSDRRLSMPSWPERMLLKMLCHREGTLNWMSALLKEDGAGPCGDATGSTSHKCTECQGCSHCKSVHWPGNVSWPGWCAPQLPASLPLIFSPSQAALNAVNERWPICQSYGAGRWWLLPPKSDVRLSG